MIAPRWLHPTNRPLPITAAPFHHETLTSYLRRLAVLNRQPPHAYRHASERATHDQALELTAALTGYPPERLSLAFPALDDPECFQTRPQSPCQHCAARHPASQLIEVRRAHHERVCLRHRRWLDAGIPLDHVPDVLAAQRRHNRVARQLPGRVHTDALAQAEDFIARWIERGEHIDRWNERISRIQQQHACWRISRNHPIFWAAAYPEIVALVPLFAARQGNGRAGRDQKLLVANIVRRLA